MATRSARPDRIAEWLSQEQLCRFRDLVEERCGLRFDESQRASLAASVQARMARLGLDDVGEYYDRLQRRSSDEEFRKLINLATITSTCFFRDPVQFQLLRRHILPRLLAVRAAAGRRLLRIWSAGCSSGEEAYSIALTLWDMGAYRACPDWTFEIVGTDLNTEVLEHARQGVYGARALRNLEGDWVQRYFQPEGPRFRLNDDIRRCVRFEHGNLTQAPLPRAWAGTVDLLVCKNVIIYFRPDVTRRLVRGFHHLLAEDGYLLLGHSETLWQLGEGFELVGSEGAFCYQKQSAAASATQADQTAPRGSVSRPRPSPAGSASAPDAASSMEEAPATRYEACLAAFRARDWVRAELLLKDLIGSSPAFVPAYLLLGGVYLHRDRDEEAVEQAARVLRLNDLEARAHLLLGIVAARRGESDDGLQALRRALYLDDSLALAHFWLGNLHRDRGDLARACREYDNVLHHWQHHSLDVTEEFALDMKVEELVDFCAQSVQRLSSSNDE